MATSTERAAVSAAVSASCSSGPTWIRTRASRRPLTGRSARPQQSERRHCRGPIPEGSYFAELPIESITPNPRQPRTVFDEDAMAELVDSINEVGLLQPVVVRPLGDGRFELVMGERRWRATQAAGLATIPAIVREDRGPRPAARRPAGEPAPGPAQPAGGGGGVPAAAGLTSAAPRTSWPAGSSGLDPRSPTPSGCSGCRRPCSGGSPPASSAPVMPGLCWRSLTPPVRSASPSGWWPRDCPSGRSRKWSRSVRRAPRPRPGAGRAARWSAPQAEDVAARLSDHLDTRVRVDLGRSEGRITIDFASAEDLERIARLIEQT